MDKLKEDLNGLQLWFLKTCWPNTSKPRVRHSFLRATCCGQKSKIMQTKRTSPLAPRVCLLSTLSQKEDKRLLLN